MRRFLLGSVILAIGVLPLAGCGKGDNDGSSPAASGPKPIKVEEPFAGKYPIQVTCTTGMVADLVKHVGGKHVQVTQLMKAGVDPHLYKPTTKDRDLLAEADVIFYSGRNLEGKMGDLFVKMARDKPVFAVTDHIDDKHILHDTEEHHDPHLWFDVSLWSSGVDVVREVLEKYDPPHAAEYRANAEGYKVRLAKLDEYARTEIAKIPEKQRVMVTAHDAFQYFGKRYGIKVRAIQGISTESEAGLKEINELVDFIVANKLKAIFVETSVSEKNIRAVIEGCKAKDHPVVIGGELYSDAMGEPGSGGETYEGMIKHNVDTIVKALK